MLAGALVLYCKLELPWLLRDAHGLSANEWQRLFKQKLLPVFASSFAHAWGMPPQQPQRQRLSTPTEFLFLTLCRCFGAWWPRLWLFWECLWWAGLPL